MIPNEWSLSLSGVVSSMFGILRRINLVS